MRTKPELLGAARDAVAPLLGARPRALVGIAGPPGAGKSTLAKALTAALIADLGPHAAVAVGMDGFHLSGVQLERLGLSNRKGAPETFDAAGFACLVERVRRADELVYAPAYSRILHESIGAVVAVPPTTRVVVVEGNYLLLEQPAWSRVRPMFDLVLYVDAPTQVRVDALVARQRARGLDEAAAHDWVHRSDEANARLVAASRHRANLVLSRADTGK